MVVAESQRRTLSHPLLCCDASIRSLTYLVQMNGAGASKATFDSAFECSSYLTLPITYHCLRWSLCVRVNLYWYSSGAPSSALMKFQVCYATTPSLLFFLSEEVRYVMALLCCSMGCEDYVSLVMP